MMAPRNDAHRGHRRGSTHTRFSLAAASLVACAHPPPANVSAAKPAPLAPVTHGVAAGDVSEHRAVVWSRSDRYSAMHVVLEGDGRAHHRVVWVTDAHDDAGKITFDDLTPRTTYRYAVWFSLDARDDAAAPSSAVTGTFRTAPSASDDTPVTFGWSGDLGGLNACRDAKRGYPVFDAIDPSKLDFFVGLGDMVYADMPCTDRGLYGGNAQIPTPVGPAATLRSFWAHWKYNREDPGLRRLLAGTAYFGVWDDHEVMNDFGPYDDWHRFQPYTIGAHLLPLGRRALLDYSPIYEPPEDPTRLYRSQRYGRNLELVILDTRSYRSANWEKDSPEHPKTMLGDAQREWFESTVLHSDATWKVVVSSVPLSVPTGRGIESAGHDGWAGYDLGVGYEQELGGIFEKFRDAGVSHLLFITTDVHFATGFAYHPFPETPAFVVYEVSAGPLGAMLLPTHAVDDTFHPERLFFFGPDQQPKTFDDAVRYMNWARVAIDRNGSLTVSIIGGDGKEVVTQPFPPPPMKDTRPPAISNGASLSF